MHLDLNKEPCQGWVQGNSIRQCKCGRASIFKLEGNQIWYLPRWDDQVLSPFYKIKEAKEAIEAVAKGLPQPEPTKPKKKPIVYRKVDVTEDDYVKTKTWIASKIKKTESSFAVLGLSPNASKEEIQVRIRELKFSLHPDRNPNDPTASSKFCNLMEAIKGLG